MRINQRETLDELLDKVQAICECGASDYKDLARLLQVHYQRVYEWVKQRKHKPPGDITLLMRYWAARKTLAIAATENNEVRRVYRAAFREVQQRRGR